ncbi:MAG: PQQ-dependent sugar dehydrogenase, partial [Chitinophagaceae bacterium]
ETRPPNSSYTPAFAGQTRIGSVQTATPWQGTVIASGLQAPWGLALLPDGRLLITQKGGTLRIATTSGQLGNAITGLPPVNSNGQGGLLDIALDPGFAQNRVLYWSFSENVSGGTVTAVATGRLSADETRVENASVIYRALPAYNGTLHYGGRIVLDGNGLLYLSTGERSDLATRPQAQQLGSALGKIIRITTAGAPAPGNPLAGTPGARPEIWSYGHRNVQGLALHPQTGALWESELGPLGGDEINRIEGGRNYGWPLITYGLEYSGTPVGAGSTQQAGMEQPVYYWDPVISPSGMTFYSGSAIAEWKHDLFVCALNGMHIARLVLRNDRVVGEERLLAAEGRRFRDITEGADGALYAITDDGRLYRIARR